MTRCDSATPPGFARLICLASYVKSAVHRATLPALAASLCLGALAQVQAQPGPPTGHRSFAAHVLRGELLVGALPLALLNGQPTRLAPGARIRGQDNLLRVPTSLAGQAVVVHYTREPSSGLLMDVWILNRAELGNEPWPTHPAEAAAWRFDPASQRWSR